MRKSIFTIVFSFVFQALTQAQISFFDKSFGNNGFVETNFGVEGEAGNSDMVLLPDGKLLVRYDQTNALGSYVRDLRLARFLPDGALDSTFGNGGVVVLDDSLAQNGGFNQGNFLIVHSAEKILTGFSNIPAQKTILMQFMADGQPDASFGSNGQLEIPEIFSIANNLSPVCKGILKQSDGQIVICYHSQGFLGDVGFRKVNADGTLPNDSEIVWANTSPQVELAHTVKTWADDKILLCGRVDDPNGTALDQDLLLASFDPFGYPDSSFGNMGFIRKDISGSSDVASDVQVLPDGKILCVGAAAFDLFLAKFNPDGTPDLLFAPGGKRVYGSLISIGYSFSIRFSQMAADQTFVVSAQPAGQTNGALFKFKANGDLDATFNGSQHVRFPTNEYYPQKPIVLADRRILVCGYKDEAQDKFFIARLLPKVGAVPFYQDADGDGFGNANAVQFWVQAPAGFVSDSLDCDDQNPNIYPGAEEICNGLDDNCDAKTDDLIITLNCIPQINIALNHNGLATLFTADINDTDPNAPCAADPSSFQVDISEFDCSDIGEQTVTLSAISAFGVPGQCQSLVKVEDFILPTANCNDQIEILLDDTGLYTLNPTLADAGSTDNCGIAEMSVSPAQFSSANLGSNIVTLTVADSSGNASSCSLTVIVSETNGTSSTILDKPFFQISPNPANESLVLHISEGVDFQKLNLLVLDASGRTLFSENHDKSGRVINLDVQNLSPGKYYVSVEMEGKFALLPFVKN